MAKIPANWGNRPICNTPAELLVWLDRQADRHLSILRPDRCKVLADGTNTGEADATYHVSPDAILDRQQRFASDILYAHDWLDANPIPSIPERPADLESAADGTIAMTERIVAEYSKLRRALAGAGGGRDEDDGQYGGSTRGVSMRDAAMILCDDDEKLARDKKDIWQKLRDPKPPPCIGRCPNHKQVKLFAPSALCDFIEKIEAQKDCQEHKLRQRLAAKARYPRQV